MPPIKDRIVYEEHRERKVTLSAMILLYNLQANMVGINQLTSVYAAPLTHDATLDFVP